MNAQLALALEARDRGIAKTRAQNSEFVRLMQEVAVMLARLQPDRTITADDLREWHAQHHGAIQPTHPNCWGAIFQNNDDFEFAGYTKSRQIQGHGNLIRRWSLR